MHFANLHHELGYLLAKSKVEPRLTAEMPYLVQAQYRNKITPEYTPEELKPIPEGSIPIEILNQLYRDYCWVWGGSCSAVRGDSSHYLQERVSKKNPDKIIESVARPQPFVTVGGKRIKVRHLLVSLFRFTEFSNKFKIRIHNDCIDGRCVNPYHVDVEGRTKVSVSDMEVNSWLHPDIEIRAQIARERILVDEKYQDMVYIRKVPIPNYKALSESGAYRKFITVGVSEIASFSWFEVKQGMTDWLRKKDVADSLKYSVKDFVEFCEMDEEPVLAFWPNFPKKFKEMFYDAPDYC